MKAETRRNIAYACTATVLTGALGGGSWYLREFSHQEPVKPETVTVYVAGVEKDLIDKKNRPHVKMTPAIVYPFDTLDYVIRIRTYVKEPTTVKVTTIKDHPTELFVDANIRGSSTQITYEKTADGWQIVETANKGVTIYRTGVMRPDEFKTLQKKTDEVIDSL